MTSRLGQHSLRRALQPNQDTTGVSRQPADAIKPLRVGTDVVGGGGDAVGRVDCGAQIHPVGFEQVGGELKLIGDASQRIPGEFQQVIGF